MTALLPVALRGIKTELVRDAVTSLCLFFNAIEQKVIDEEKLLDLERRHFETLRLLEATFPPSFFDLMAASNITPLEEKLVPWPILPSSNVSI
jgi:hypothetical protein